MDGYDMWLIHLIIFMQWCYFEVGPWVILPDCYVWNVCFFIRGKWNKLLGQPFRIWRRMGQLLLPILNQISQQLSLPICIKKMDLRVVMSSWLEQILWVTAQPLKHCTLIPVGLRFHKLMNLFAVFWYVVLWLPLLIDAIEY